MAKPFQSYADQINKLKNEKLLNIPDTVYAEEMLKRISYFSLINGYKDPFKNKTTKKYRDGTSFNDIVALYKLDENLRELFLKYILQIERHLRSLLSYYFTEKHGDAQSCYLDLANYTSIAKHRFDVTRLIGVLEKLANQSSDYPYINHHRSIHGNVPLWVLVNGITFGTLSKFYALVSQDIKANISKNFVGVNEKQLEQYLTVITKFRNVCAHNERLYSFKTKDAIPDTPLHKKLCISKKGTQYSMGKQDLFALVIAFRYLLPDSDFKKFKKGLKRILRHYFSAQRAISECDLLMYMGFPSNWNKITRYKK